MLKLSKTDWTLTIFLGVSPSTWKPSNGRVGGSSSRDEALPETQSSFGLLSDSPRKGQSLKFQLEVSRGNATPSEQDTPPWRLRSTTREIEKRPRWKAKLDSNGIKKKDDNEKDEQKKQRSREEILDQKPQPKEDPARIKLRKKDTPYLRNCSAKSPRLPL